MKQINFVIHSCRTCIFFRENIHGKYCCKLEIFLPIKLHHNAIYDKCELMDYKP